LYQNVTDLDRSGFLYYATSYSKYSIHVSAEIEGERIWGQSEFEMDMELARMIVSSAYRARVELGHLMPLLRQHGDTNDDPVREAIASAVYEVWLIADNVFNQYPELNVEAESRAQKFGRDLLMDIDNYSHQVDVDESTRKIRIDRIFSDGSKHFYAEASLPERIDELNRDSYADFMRVLGEAIILDSPAARRALGL
jgi:hypothetical protein